MRPAEPLRQFLSLIVVFLGSLEPTLGDELGNNPVVYVNASSGEAVNGSSCWTAGRAGPCLTLELGLQGLGYLAPQRANATLLIAPGEYDLQPGNFTSFANASGLSIACDDNIALEAASCVTITCDRNHGVGFSFINSTNVTISGIVFSHCGGEQKSTSFNFDRDNPDFVSFTVTLYFSNCKNVSLSQVVVRNTKGIGAVLYNTVGNNNIAHSTFTENQFVDKAGGGGLYVEFSYCDPVDPVGGLNCLKYGIPNVNHNYTANSSFHIYNCTFAKNRANISESKFSSKTFILPHAKEHLAFGRGGGLSVFFKGNATENTVVVEKCTFDSNSAVWGAGIFVEFQDSVLNNQFCVNDSYVLNNSLYYDDLHHEGTGGGGARVGFIYFDNFAAHSNWIIFQSCHFEENVAYFGGGISYYSARNSQDLSPNVLFINNCNFSYNMGPLGAALDMSLWHTSISGSEPIALIQDTMFVNNSAVRTSTQGSFNGMGVVYSDTMALQLLGSVKFEGNSGTALAATGGNITLSEDSSLHFKNNSGRHGGAIAFFGNTYILVKHNSKLYFINNSADYYGGAIYSYQSGEHDLISSRSCFIRYYNVSATPFEWNVYFYFAGNLANHRPNAIYASSLLPCIWGGPQGGMIVGEDLQNVFCWGKDKWVYYNTTNCSEVISTSPYSVQMNENYTSMPGKTLQIQANVTDETLHNVTGQTVFVARIQQGNAHFRGSEHLDYTYVSHGLLDLRGKPNSIVTIEMETLDPIVIKSTITVNLQACPPGFVSHFSDADSTSNSTCVCPGTYHNYIVCDSETFRVSMLQSAWIGHVTGFSDFLVGESPFLGDVEKGPQLDLTDVSPEPAELNAFLCGDSGRRGVLCASCQDGYGVGVNSGSFNCKPCPSDVVYYRWALYIVTKFVPITVFFFAVFVLSMMVPFGPLTSFIFFAQVLPIAVNIDADGTIYLNNVTSNHFEALKSAYMVVYDIWNLNFFDAWIPDFCLSPNLNTLDVLSLGYITALYPLLLLIVFVIVVSLYNRGVWLVVSVFRPLHLCLARFRQFWNLRRSISGGIALFLIISYTKFGLVSFILLTPNQLYRANGTVATRVCYYQGDKHFGSSETIVYLVVASLVLATFVILPPILLVLPSLLTFAVRFRWFQCLRSLQPQGKMQEFLDFFHGCFKDGTDGGLDCRWFAGLYFILRIILLALYTGTPTWELQYTVQILFYLVWAFLFATLRPYKQEWINYVDMSMFLILAAITALSMYNLFLTFVHLPISTWAFAVQYILIFIPLFYCAGYFIVLFCLENKLFLWRKFLRHNVAADGLPDIQQEDSTYLDDAGIAGFLDFTQATGRLSGRMRLTDPQRWQSQHSSHRVRQPLSTTAGDDAERRPLISTSSDEQSADE